MLPEVSSAAARDGLVLMSSRRRGARTGVASPCVDGQGRALQGEAIIIVVAEPGIDW